LYKKGKWLRIDGKVNMLQPMSSYGGIAGRHNFIFYLATDQLCANEYLFPLSCYIHLNPIRNKQFKVDDLQDRRTKFKDLIAFFCHPVRFLTRPNQD
jgi:hypothetical protein